MRRRLILTILLIGLSLLGVGLRNPPPPRQSKAAASSTPAAAPALAIPLKPKSVRFAVIGDNGTGTSEEYEVGQRMAEYRQASQFDFVLMLGDNIYGGHSPRDFAAKFEEPYKALLDVGVKFYASLGNHDNPNERFYKPYNMNEQRYYTFTKGNVRFFALDSNYMDPQQVQWLEKQLQSSTSEWKICYFHHPLYSSAATHGPDLNLRALLEPLFMRYKVDVVLSGHDHVYERIRPQRGIYYFVEGSAGQLRYHDLRSSNVTAVGFDTDRSFMLIEIAGDEMYFQTISRVGRTVDSGVIRHTTKTSMHAYPAASPESSKPVFRFGRGEAGGKRSSGAQLLEFIDDRIN